MWKRGLRWSRNDLTDILSSCSSSKAGDNGRGIGWVTRESNGEVMLLFSERRLGLFGNGGGCSLKRLSRYAGLLPEVEGRGNTIAILIFVWTFRCYWNKVDHTKKSTIGTAQPLSVEVKILIVS